MSKQTKVVMVDDDNITQTMFKEAMQEAHLKVHTCESPEALDIIKQVKPDIIILDVVMPVLDGFDLCALIKSDNTINDIPIIMLSSASSEENIRKSEELGVVSFVSKPVKLTEFIHLVESHDAIHEMKQSWINTSKIMGKLLDKYYDNTAIKVS